MATATHYVLESSDGSFYPAHVLFEVGENVPYVYSDWPEVFSGSLAECESYCQARLSEYALVRQAQMEAEWNG